MWKSRWPSLIVCRVSVDINQQWTRTKHAHIHTTNKQTNKQTKQRRRRRSRKKLSGLKTLCKYVSHVTEAKLSAYWKLVQKLCTAGFCLNKTAVQDKQLQCLHTSFPVRITGRVILSQLKWFKTIHPGLQVYSSYQRNFLVIIYCLTKQLHEHINCVLHYVYISETKWMRGTSKGECNIYGDLLICAKFIQHLQYSIKKLCLIQLPEA